MNYSNYLAELKITFGRTQSSNLMSTWIYCKVKAAECMRYLKFEKNVKFIEKFYKKLYLINFSYVISSRRNCENMKKINLNYS